MKISPNIGLNIPEGNDIFDHDKFLTKNLEKVDQYLMNATNVTEKFNQVESSLAQIATLVTDFGAKGDGVTDDTAAIDAAITYCFNNKKVLDFGSKTYVYNRPTTWYIDGQYDGRFINWVGKGAKIIFKRLDIAYIAFYKMEYVNIEGINFEGPGDVGSSPNQNAVGIASYSSKRMNVSKCSFTNFVGDGLFISSEQVDDRKLSTQNLNVHNCYFNNNGRGGLTIVGCVSGNVKNNHFANQRLSVAPVIGDMLHIESDPSTRYGVESLEISNNLIYGTVNLSNVSWQTGWVGNKNTWIDFNHNLVVVDDNAYSDFGAYGIVSAGGNIKITDNEIEVSRISVSDDLGVGALFLKCNAAIIKRNTIKTVGKGTIISIYNWTHDNKGDVVLEDNVYISNDSTYIYRFYKDGVSTNLHRITKIKNENYTKITNGGWLMTASDGGSSKYYRVEGITFPGFSGIDLLNPPSTFAVYLKDCVMTLSGTLFQWNALGSAPKIYHSNCKLSGASSNNILVFPVELIGSYKFTSGTGTLYWYFKDTLSIGRSGTITKSSTGSYTFNPFTTLELASYSISYNLLYVSTESRSLNLIAVNGAFDGDRNKLLVKDNTGTPVDLVDNMIIQVKGTLVDDTLKALMAS